MRPKEWTPETIFSMLKERWPESFYDLYPGYSKPEREDRDCFYQSKKQAFAVANEILEKFNALPKLIPIFRVIAVKSETHIDLESPGNNWSYKKKSALSFGERELPEKSKKALLTGVIPFDEVDWYTTLQKDLIFSQGDYAEHEIYISDPKVIQKLKWNWV